MHVDPASTLRVSHLGDWTIVSVRAGYDHAELIDAAAPELARGARLVLDFHGSPADPDARAEVLTRLSRAAVDGSARLVVVERETAVRERWREIGVAEVHESLDDAVGDVAPAVLDGPPREHLLPAAGDATLVATDDISDNPTSL
jgi:hypothetical protein